MSYLSHEFSLCLFGDATHGYMRKIKLKFLNWNVWGMPNSPSQHNQRFQIHPLTTALYFVFQNQVAQPLPFSDLTICISWLSNPIASNPFDLHHKLKGLSKAITSRAKGRMGTIRTQIQICRTFLGQINRQYENRRSLKENE